MTSTTIRPTHQSWKIFAVVSLVVLVTRIPFIFDGYGNDGDAWWLAEAAKRLATTGEYHISRPPGHPLQELVCALLWSWGPAGLNGATAILSALGVGFFVLTMRALGSRQPYLAGAALAFAPVVWIHSTDALDYVWALSFILAALYAVLRRHIVVAGILLALAVACRATSLLMILPLTIFVRHGGRPRDTFLFILTAALGILTYVPAYTTHGDYIFTVWEHGYPRIPTLIYMGTVQMWGSLGAVAIGLALAHWVAGPRPIQTTSTIPSRVSIAASGVAILVYGLAFLRLPHEPGYLIPIVPFTVLLLHCLLNERIFVIVCAAIAVSSLVSGLRQRERVGDEFLESAAAVPFSVGSVEMVWDPLYGPVIHESKKRRARLDLVGRVVEISGAETEEVLYVVGGLIAPITVGGDYGNDRANFTAVLTEEQANHCLTNGVDVYYLEDIGKRYSEAVTGVDLDRVNARYITDHPRF